MSDLIEKKDLIIRTNDVIKKNIEKLKNKLISIKDIIELEDEENYDNIYCKINIYFTSLLNKIRIKYFNAIEKYRRKIKQNEKDILRLIMDNMLLIIENNFLKEKTKLLDKIGKNDYPNNFKKIKSKQKYQSQENINKYKYDRGINNKSKNNTPIKSRNINNNIYANEKSFNYNINNNNNNYDSYIKEIEKNIRKHKNTQSDFNIRKIKDEMNSIINKNSYKNNNIYNNDNMNIINEQITQNFFMKKNMCHYYHNKNNISKNYIHNTSINIFNTSNSFNKIKTKSDKYIKNNKNIVSLKSLYNNIIINKKIKKDNNKILLRKNKNNSYNDNTSNNIGKSSSCIYKTEFNEKIKTNKNIIKKKKSLISKNKSFNKINKGKKHMNKNYNNN